MIELSNIKYIYKLITFCYSYVKVWNKANESVSLSVCLGKGYYHGTMDGASYITSYMNTIYTIVYNVILGSCKLCIGFTGSTVLGS